MDFPGGSVLRNLHANAKDTGNVGSISGCRRSPGVENGNFSILALKIPWTEKPVWLVFGASKTGTRLSTYTHYIQRPVPGLGLENQFPYTVNRTLSGPNAWREVSKWGIPWPSNGQDSGLPLTCREVQKKRRFKMKMCVLFDLGILLPEMY